MFDKVSSKDLQVFTQQFSTLVSSKLSLSKSMEIIISEQKNKVFKEALRSIAKRVNEGNSLHESFARYPKIFDRFFCQMVKVGEKSGQIDIIFTKLNQFLKRSETLKQKLISSLSYPLIIVLITIIAIVFLMVFVVPEFQEIFKNRDTKLPWITEQVISLSNFIRAYYWLIPILLILIPVTINYSYKKKEGYRFLSKLVLNIPLFGNWLKNVYIAKMTMILSTLLDAKVSLIEALEIAKNSMKNYLFEKELKRMIQYTSKGERLSTSISKSSVFPEMIVQMLSVGEETAQIHKMLQEVSDYYQSEVDHLSERFTSLLEPIMIVGLGLIVAVIVIAIYLPMFDLGSVMGL
jgi:type IV pilus assembly protein PilC